MPELCRFDGIIIRTRFRNHLPPHFHVAYGEFDAQTQENRRSSSKRIFASEPPDNILSRGLLSRLIVNDSTDWRSAQILL